MPAYNANTTLTGAVRLRYRLNWGRRVPLTRPDTSVWVRPLEAGKPPYLVSGTLLPVGPRRAGGSCGRRGSEA